MQTDRLFEIEPPLALDRHNSTRNSGRLVCPMHAELFRELFSDVMTTCAHRALICLLQCKHVDTR